MWNNWFSFRHFIDCKFTKHYYPVLMHFNIEICGDKNLSQTVENYMKMPLIHSYEIGKFDNEN
jgi:hypothetical protein